MDQLGKATLEDDHNMFSYLLLFPAFYVSYLRLPANGIRQSQLPEELFSSRAGKGLPMAQSSYTLCLHPPFPASAPQPESENQECLYQGKSGEPKRTRSLGKSSSFFLWSSGTISMVHICRSDHDGYNSVQWHRAQLRSRDPCWGEVGMQRTGVLVQRGPKNQTLKSHTPESAAGPEV